MKTISRLLPHFPLIFALVLGNAACDPKTKGGLRAITSRAKGKIHNLKTEPWSGYVNGDLDYGYRVSFEVENVAAAGVISVNPRLSCSEGEWERKQNLNFDAKETKTLTYFFHEPTINVTNVECDVELTP